MSQRGFRGRDRPENDTNSGSKRQKTKDSKGSGGLNVELHPFLKDMVPIPQATRPGKKNVRREFDPTALNPYLDQSNIGMGRKVRSRALQFNTPGKYIEQGEKLRQQLRQEQAEQDHQRSIQEKGLLPDKDLGEEAYQEQLPPELEWWDSYYINGHNYEDIDNFDNLVLDNEFAPVTKYIQHPVMEEAPYEKHLPSARPMYLTKKELKRKRKNERQEKFRIQQERVRKGLDPPPPPKVKLSNLMSVLTNEAIRDPTSVEKRVKKEVQQRYTAHMKANEDRKLSKDEKHEKDHQKRQQDLAKGYFRNIYKVNQLVDSQHFFKVDKNAQQLELNGLCVVTDNMTLIIVEGGSKALKFYDKLLMRRIDWKKSNSSADLSQNSIKKVWEGQLKDPKFQRWSILKVKDDEALQSVLDRFDIEQLWRSAAAN